MSHLAYQPVRDFEQIVADYAGSKYAVALDNCTNALFLCMKYIDVAGKEVTIPSHTFVSVPCAIIHAGGKVKFEKGNAKGAYQLKPFPIIDGALRFEKGMYEKGTHHCLSFTGPHKHLKLGKGGMILTDDEKAYEWFKLARYMGRHEVSHLTDNFSMVGWNFYMTPDVAARGLVLMMGVKDTNPDIEAEYQDLSKYEMFKE